MADWQSEWLPRLTALLQDKRLPLLLSLALTLLLAQGLARLTWTVLPPPESVNGAAAIEALQSASPAVTRSATKQQTRASASSVERLHLFGEAQQKVVSKPKAQAKPLEAPDTKLKLKLHGVLASDDPNFARAIIADARGKEDAYAVEDALPGNAVLKEIYADRIILQYRGQLETLRLPRDNKLAAGSRVTRSAARRGSAPAGVNTTETSAMLRQYRDALVTDPQSVMDLLRAEPVRDRATGRVKGYRIRPGRDRQMLGRFGLRDGDIVTSINGVSLDNPLKALELMRDVSSMTQINLDVERNGAAQSFSFQIE